MVDSPWRSMNLIQVTGNIHHSHVLADSKMLKDWSHTSNAREVSPAGCYLIHSFRRIVRVRARVFPCFPHLETWGCESEEVMAGARGSWLDWSRLAWPKPSATQSPTPTRNFWGSTGTHKASGAHLSPWTVCCEWDDFRKSRALSASARQVLRRMSWANLFQGLLGNGNPIWMEWLLFNKMFNLKKFPQRALSMSA